jgi:hypothetical protein
MVIASLAAFIFLVFAVSIRAGRMAGLALTAVCGGAMAFFLMPPFFSFRVAQTSDLVTLAFYGTAGLVLAQLARPGKREAFVESYVDVPSPARRPPAVNLADVVADLSASEIGSGLRESALALALEGCSLPCTANETLRILTDTIDAALAVPGVQRISIYRGQQPSGSRLKVVAHRIWPTPQNEVIVIGRRDSSCVPVEFTGWPANARANWFENGYARIYQIWVESDRTNESNGTESSGVLT